MTTQTPVENEAATEARDRDGRDAEHLGDLLVGLPSFLFTVGGEQDAGARDLAGFANPAAGHLQQGRLIFVGEVDEQFLAHRARL